MSNNLALGLVYANTPITPGSHLGATELVQSSRHHIPAHRIIEVELAAIEANPLTVAVQRRTQVDAATGLPSREHLVIWQRFMSDEARLEWELFEAVFNGFVYRRLDPGFNLRDILRINRPIQLRDGTIVPPFPSVYPRWPVRYYDLSDFCIDIPIGSPFSARYGAVGDVNMVYDSPLLYTETVQRNLLTGAEIVNPSSLISESRRPCSFSRVRFDLVQPRHRLSTYLHWPTTSLRPTANQYIISCEPKILGWIVREGALLIELAVTYRADIDHHVGARIYYPLLEFLNEEQEEYLFDGETDEDGQLSVDAYLYLPEFQGIWRSLTLAHRRLQQLNAQTEGPSHAAHRQHVRWLLSELDRLVRIHRAEQRAIATRLSEGVRREGALVLCR